MEFVLSKQPLVTVKMDGDLHGILNVVANSKLDPSTTLASERGERRTPSYSSRFFHSNREHDKGSCI